MKTTQNLQKWGNSLAVRIPKKVIDATNLKHNQELIVSINNDSIVLTPVKKQKAKTVSELFKGVKPSDVSGELDWGEEVGTERIDG